MPPGADTGTILNAVMPMIERLAEVRRSLEFYTSQRMEARSNGYSSRRSACLPGLASLREEIGRSGAGRRRLGPDPDAGRELRAGVHVALAWPLQVAGRGAASGSISFRTDLYLRKRAERRSPISRPRSGGAIALSCLTSSGPDGSAY